MSPAASTCLKCFGSLARGTGRCGDPSPTLAPLVCPNDKRVVNGNTTSGRVAETAARFEFWKEDRQ